MAEDKKISELNIASQPLNASDTFVVVQDGETKKVRKDSIFTVDTAMSDTSTNAVQNKVIKAYADTKWSKEVVEVDRYENIPLDAGYYMTYFADEDTSYEIELDTNMYNYLDNSVVNITDIKLGTTLDSVFMVKREKLQVKFVVDIGGGSSISYDYVDTLYDQKGHEIGTVRPFDIGKKVELNQDYFPYLVEKNRYLRPYELTASNSNFYKGVIEIELDNNNFNNGTLVMPYELVSNKLKVISSEVFVNNSKIKGYKIGLLSHPTENKIAISGINANSDFKNIVKILIEYKSGNISNPDSRITPFLNNTKANVVNLETLVVHSDAMVLTFNEVNTGFAGTMFDANSSNILDFQGDNYLTEIADNNVDFMFSAASGMTFLRNTFIDDTYSVIPIGSNNLTRIDLTDAIDKFPPNYISVTSRSETDNTGTDPLGTSYGFGTEFNEPTLSADLTGQGLTDWGGSTEHQQSPATAIVAGKLKKIKDDTGATWDVVRESARRSASNYGSYNIYRGFGVIDVALAITLVPTVESERSLELAEYWKNVTPFNQNLKFEDKSDYTPVVKKDLKDTKSYLSGRIGNAMEQPTGEVILKFDEFWSDNGTISHNVTDGKFTFSKSGVYNVTFNGLNNDAGTRIFLLKNRITIDNVDNFGQARDRITTTQITLNSTFEIEAGDYIVFNLYSGSLFNAPTFKANEFLINKIAS